jgi:hypothetical protein
VVDNDRHLSVRWTGVCISAYTSDKGNGVRRHFLTPFASRFRAINLLKVIFSYFPSLMALNGGGI